MEYSLVPVGMLGTNACVVWCPAEGTVYLIDPGAEAERIIARAEKFPAKQVRILLTHAHFDHIGAAGAVAAHFGVPAVELAAADFPLYHSKDNAMPPFCPAVEDLPPAVEFAPSDDFVRLALPGHSPGGSGFLFRGENASVLFAGDTIFAGSMGRTDLWGGDEALLLKSIRDRIMTLPDEVVIVPGHGETTSVGVERRTNPCCS